jgi:hypothetical protein
LSEILTSHFAETATLLPTRIFPSHLRCDSSRKDKILAGRPLKFRPGHSLSISTTQKGNKMTILTLEHHRLLLRNGSPAQTGKDHFPVAKLILPELGCALLLTECDPTSPMEVFGLADWGFGCPRYDWDQLELLTLFRSYRGYIFRQDLDFKAQFPLSVYARAAVQTGKLTTCEETVRKYVLHDRYNPAPLSA